MTHTRSLPLSADRLAFFARHGAALAQLTRPLETSAQGLAQHAVEQRGEGCGRVGAGVGHAANVGRGEGSQK